MDPSIKKGIQKRREWIRRNPGAAGDYIRLGKEDRNRVDELFLANRRLKAHEVTSRVENLTEERLRKRRTGNLRDKALANLRARLSDRERYRDVAVVTNVKKMSGKQLKQAATSSVDELINLARVAEEGNPFWYH